MVQGITGCAEELMGIDILDSMHLFFLIYNNLSLAFLTRFQ